MFRYRPAMKFAVPLACGIIIGWEWAFPLWVPLSAAAFGAALLYLFRNSPQVSGLALTALIFFAGLAKITYDAGSSEPDNVGGAAAYHHPVLLSGRLVEPPRFSPRAVHFVLDAETLWIEQRSCPVAGGVLVTVRRGKGYDSLLARLTYGREMTVSGLLTPPEGMRNPGEFDRAAYLRLNDVFAEMFIQKRDTIIAPGAVSAPSLLARWVYPARRWVGRVLDHYFRGEEAEFLKGLIIGERSDISFEVKSAFISAGVMHILAVSGLHVVIVSMMLLVILEILRVPQKVRLILMGLILTYYTFFTGASASVARSVLMALVLLFAPWTERKADVYNALAFSAIVVLLADARQLFQPGFQLSYVAVFSLVYLYPKVARIGTLLPERLQHSKILGALGAGLGVSVAAGLGTIPFGAYYFGKISLVGVVANLVIVPLSNLILCLGMLTVALAPVSAWLAGVYAAATSLSTWLLLRSVEFFARVPYAFVAGRFGAGFFVVSYGLLALGLNIGRPERRPAALLGTLLALNALVFASAFDGREPGLRVTMVDVGQGDAILVQLPEGHAILVDAGPRLNGADAGERFLLPYLRYRGVDRLDAVVVSHPHGDHLGGVPAVLRHLPVGMVFDCGSALQGALPAEYAHLIDSLGLAHRNVRRGERLDLVPSVRCYVLSPGEGSAPDDTLDNHAVNNQSVVLRIVYGRTSILLSGDAEVGVEEEIAERYATFLKSDILKTGHHGSKTSSSDPYLDAVKPAVAMISVGARNTFGHPSPGVLARLVGRGVRILRTDREGAVILESDGALWHEVAWR